VAYQKAKLKVRRAVYQGQPAWVIAWRHWCAVCRMHKPTRWCSRYATALVSDVIVALDTYPISMSCRMCRTFRYVSPKQIPAVYEESKLTAALLEVKTCD